MKVVTFRCSHKRRHVALWLVSSLLFAGVAAWAQADKPNFSGRWEPDKERSTGPGNPAAEVIDHKDPQVVITSTLADGSSFAIRLSTDGKERLNIIGGREMRSTTTWDGNSLVTLVRDAQGMQFTEVRSLSEDGKVQTIEGFMDPGRTRAMFKRVAVKKD
jgi:hypothetical protein